MESVRETAVTVNDIVDDVALTYNPSDAIVA